MQSLQPVPINARSTTKRCDEARAVWTDGRGATGMVTPMGPGVGGWGSKAEPSENLDTAAVWAPLPISSQVDATPLDSPPRPLCPCGLRPCEANGRRTGWRPLCWKCRDGSSERASRCACGAPLSHPATGGRRLRCEACAKKQLRRRKPIGETKRRASPRLLLRCGYCGAAFDVKPSRKARGQRCCSKSCAKKLRATPPASSVVYSDCERCGRLVASKRHVRFCSDSCRRRPLRPKPERPVPATSVEYLDCAECGRLFVGRAGAGRRYCSRSCGRRVEKRTRLRKLKQGARRETFTTREIAERDGWRCHICGKKVPDRPYKARALDPTIDHLVPVSAGGDHTRANVALAHNRCNYDRSVGGEVQLRLVG